MRAPKRPPYPACGGCGLLYDAATGLLLTSQLPSDGESDCAECDKRERRPKAGETWHDRVRVGRKAHVLHVEKTRVRMRDSDGREYTVSMRPFLFNFTPPTVEQERQDIADYVRAVMLFATVKQRGNRLLAYIAFSIATGTYQETLAMLTAEERRQLKRD